MELVQALKAYLADLVTMGIDKCKGRKLFVCPALFMMMYLATFNVSEDEVHFAYIDLSEEEYARCLKSVYVYDEKGWRRLGGWHSGSAPIPYILFKLKDLIRACSEVFAEKGMCCRQR